MSRTSPRASANHDSSPRRGTAQPGRSSGANARRSDRRRRVPTLAWCTASGSRPARTPPSLATTRRTERASPARSTSRALGSSPSSGTSTSPGSDARGPRTRATLERWPPGRAPAATNRSTTAATTSGGRGATRPGLVIGPRLHLELPEAHGQVVLVVGRHLVVDHLGKERAVGGGEVGRPPLGLDAGHGGQDGAAAPRRQLVEDGGGDGLGTALVGGLRAAHRPLHPRTCCRQLQRPPRAVTLPVAQRDARAGQAQVGGVVVHRHQVVRSRRDHPHPVHPLPGHPLPEVGERGHPEPRPHVELDLLLELGPGRSPAHRLTTTSPGRRWRCSPVRSCGPRPAPWPGGRGRRGR